MVYLVPCFFSKNPGTIENDSLTPTLKLKRRVIVAEHGDEIEKLYENFGK